jgi:hypothetical protein
MADLVVTLTEALTLNGSAISSSNAKTIAVTTASKQIVTVPANVDTTVALFKSSVGISDVALDVELVKYIRITNLDGSNSVNLELTIDAGEDDSAADESATILLEAGKSFVMGSPSDGISAAGPATELHNLESILVDSVANEVTVEVFIAG